jgi:hypothetical protein
MANICIEKNCNNERHDKSRHCIFHCDKKDFSDENIKLFWETIKQTYYIDDRRNSTYKIIEVLNIKFPDFQINRSVYKSNLNFFYDHLSSRNQTIKFINCMFFNDFNLNSAKIKHIIFDNCIFHGDLKGIHLQTLEIINSEFKGEISFENIVCDVIKIKEKSEFKKDANFIVSKAFNVIDSLFKGTFTFVGENECLLTIEKSKFNKTIEISNTDEINITNIDIKSNLSFLKKNSNIHLENIIFSKNVNFNDSIRNIVLDKVEINNDINLEAINILEIKNNSIINGNLNLKDVGDNLVINESKINKKINASNLKNVDINNSTLNDKFTNISSTNDFKIEKSYVKDLELCTTHSLTLSNTTFDGLVNLFGDKYTNVTIENCTSNNELLINNTTDNLTILKLLRYPSLKLIMPDCESINVDNSRLSKLIINKAKNLVISKSIIKDDFIIEEDTNIQIMLDDTKFKKQCYFPSIYNLTIQNKCIFSEEVTFDKIQTGKFYNSSFNEVVQYKEKSDYLSFESCNFKKGASFSSIDEINITNTVFDDELSFFEATLQKVLFHNTITKNVNFQKSNIKKISFTSTKDSEDYKTIIKGNIDFSYSQIDEIEIDKSCFYGQLIFNQIINALDLDKINNVDFKDKLLINQSKIHNLFLGAKNITINNLDISNSYLTAKNSNISKDTLTIKDIKINTFKLKEVNFIDDVNFQNLEIEKLLFTNSNIEKVFRIKNCFIQTIESQDNIFEDLQLIDNQYNKNKDIKRNISFQNTTIKNAVFDKLKFDEFKMNDAHVSSAKIGYVEFEKASRETNRFFKNYYDSISDFVTANKYYAKEMIEQLKVSKGEDKIIFYLNKGFSNFGQSWLLPLVWMLVCTLIFCRIANFDLLSLTGFRENHITWMLNDILKFSNPFSKTSTSNYGTMYWAWLLHKLVMTALMYHFVVAVKRRTKR